MKFRKIIAGVMALSVMTGALQFFSANAVDFNTGSFTDEITDYNDKSLSYTLTLHTNRGSAKLSAASLTDNTIAITGVESLPTGKVDLVIPNEVDNLKISTIYKSAFYNVEGIRSVELSEGITAIGAYAFADCDDIETIKLPSTITTMETSPFAAIDNLKSITVASGGILRTDNGALRDGSNIYCYPPMKTDLTSYTVTYGIKNIRPYCFYFNRTLKTITLPTSVEKIYPSAFVGTSYCTVTIMNKNCEFGVFDESGFENPKFFDSTTTIRGYKGSTAETYAKANNLKFVDIEATATTTTTTKATTTTTRATTTTTKATTKATTTATKATTTATKATTKATTTTLKTTTAVSSEKFLLGDANCDEAVNIADAAAIIQHLGNRDKYGLSEQGLKNADCCNVGDGVTGLDALAIQKLEANQITELPDIS